MTDAATQLDLLTGQPVTTVTVGYCPECGKTPTINHDGTLHQHSWPPLNTHALTGQCPGSGSEPKSTWLVTR